MTFWIEYYRAGTKIGCLPCPKPRSEAAKAARVGLRRFEADTARILDEEGSILEIVTAENQ